MLDALNRASANEEGGDRGIWYKSQADEQPVKNRPKQNQLLQGRFLAKNLPDDRIAFDCHAFFDSDVRNMYIKDGGDGKKRGNDKN